MKAVANDRFEPFGRSAQNHAGHGMCLSLRLFHSSVQLPGSISVSISLLPWAVCQGTSLLIKHWPSSRTSALLCVPTMASNGALFAALLHQTWMPKCRYSQSMLVSCSVLLHCVASAWTNSINYQLNMYIDTRFCVYSVDLSTCMQLMRFCFLFAFSALQSPSSM